MELEMRSKNGPSGAEVVRLLPCPATYLRFLVLALCMVCDHAAAEETCSTLSGFADVKLKQVEIASRARQLERDRETTEASWLKATGKFAHCKSEEVRLSIAPEIETLGRVRRAVETVRHAAQHRLDEMERRRRVIEETRAATADTALYSREMCLYQSEVGLQLDVIESYVRAFSEASAKLDALAGLCQPAFASDLVRKFSEMIEALASILGPGYKKG